MGVRPSGTRLTSCAQGERPGRLVCDQLLPVEPPRRGRYQRYAHTPPAVRRSLTSVNDAIVLSSMGATGQSRLELEELPEVFHQVREVRTLSQRPFCRMVCTRTMAPG